MSEPTTLRLVGFWCPWKRFIEATDGDTEADAPNEKYQPVYVLAPTQSGSTQP